MIGFLIKKGFFDIWDNLLMLVLMSIGYIAPLAILLLASYLTEVSMAMSVLVAVLAILASSLYSLGVNAIVYGYSRYQKQGFRGFREAYRYHIGHAFLHFGLYILIGFLCLFGIPFYMSMGNIAGYIFGMLVFWMVVALVFTIQYFWPLCFHMEADGPIKTLKKCFLIVADNPGTTLFLMLRTLVDLALTVLTASMIPGLAGIALSRMDTVRLLMKKYDFLEKNPDCGRKDVNWEDLLFEERELVGPRTFKGMIFPWKD